MIELILWNLKMINGMIWRSKVTNTSLCIFILIFYRMICGPAVANYGGYVIQLMFGILGNFVSRLRRFSVMFVVFRSCSAWKVDPTRLSQSTMDLLVVLTLSAFCVFSTLLTFFVQSLGLSSLFLDCCIRVRTWVLFELTPLGPGGRQLYNGALREAVGGPHHTAFGLFYPSSVCDYPEAYVWINHFTKP